MSDVGGEIYLINNIKNNKKYIGQTTLQYSGGRKGGGLKRWKKHLNNARTGSNECRALVNAIRKYGQENFTIEILVQCNKDQLDYYERKFIYFYDSLHPNGYNLESGGSGCKIMSLESRELISSKSRFRYMSKLDKKKVLSIMEELKIESLPMGICYTHDNNSGYEGFVVSGVKKRAFIAKGRTLSEKLIQALTYYKLIKENDIEQLEIFNKNIVKESSILIKNSKKSLDLRVLEAMKNIGISEIPMYIRYEKRNQRFYVKPPNELCHYFKKYDPEESLKQSIEYMNKWQQRESV
jgi:hypothetical protein